MPQAIQRILLAAGLMVLGLGPVSAPAPADGKGAGAAPQQASAIFAGGCFWCVESDFDKVPGVISTTSGYTGGKLANPTYGQVSAGGTGHAEAVRVVFDPSKVSYAKLLDVFWHSIDPLTKNAQFCDTGSQYRSAIFTLDAEQARLARESKDALKERFRQPVVTEISPASAFYPAEEYHQDYAAKNPVKYKFYRWNCGRDARLKEVWGADAGGDVKS